MSERSRSKAYANEITFEALSLIRAELDANRPREERARSSREEETNPPTSDCNRRTGVGRNESGIKQNCEYTCTVRQRLA